MTSVSSIAQEGLSKMKQIANSVAESTANAAQKTGTAIQDKAESIFKVSKETVEKMQNAANEMNKPMVYSAGTAITGGVVAAASAIAAKLVSNKAAINILKKTGLVGGLIAIVSAIAFDRFRTNKKIDDAKAEAKFNEESAEMLSKQYTYLLKAVNQSSDYKEIIKNKLKYEKENTEKEKPAEK